VSSDGGRIVMYTLVLTRVFFHTLVFDAEVFPHNYFVTNVFDAFYFIMDSADYHDIFLKRIFLTWLLPLIT